jgi:cytochrome c
MFVRLNVVMLALLALLISTSSAQADGMASPKEAQAMSRKAMTTIHQIGAKKAFALFADPKGGFQVKDLYVFCMDKDGVMLSHAKKSHLVGKNLIKFKKYGDLLFQDMIKVAAQKGQGWVDYRWPYPGSDEIKKKTSFITSHPAKFFCGVGAYK